MIVSRFLLPEKLSARERYVFPFLTLPCRRIADRAKRIPGADLTHDGAQVPLGLRGRLRCFQLGFDPDAGSVQIGRQGQVQRAIRVGIKNSGDRAHGPLNSPRHQPPQTGFRPLSTANCPLTTDYSGLRPAL